MGTHIPNKMLIAINTRRESNHSHKKHCGSLKKVDVGNYCTNNAHKVKIITFNFTVLRLQTGYDNLITQSNVLIILTFDVQFPLQQLWGQIISLSSIHFIPTA